MSETLISEKSRALYCFEGESETRVRDTLSGQSMPWTGRAIDLSKLLECTGLAALVRVRKLPT
jgi:hypothetical protein